MAVIEGTPQHADATGAIAPSSRREIDEALAELGRHKDEWTELAVRDRIAILRELRQDFRRVAEPWVRASCEAKGLAADSPTAGEEWIAGPYLIFRNLRLLEAVLGEIEEDGRPRIPGPVSVRPDGQVVARVFPHSRYDRLLYSGIDAGVWMEPGIGRDELAETQAVAYQQPVEGRICLVLGAGNVSSIGPMDALYKLFVEKRVVIYKTHPVNSYLGPLLAEGFQALLDWGVMRIVHGGAEEGDYLCRHEAVDEIHITGSDKTVEAIVFGPGEEGKLRKEQRRPRLTKPISSELGNVSPVIAVPGPWTEDQLKYQAENVVSMLVNNAGFNCNAVRVLIQHARWRRRDAFRYAIEDVLEGIDTRKAYYPGARERFYAFLDDDPGAERFGDPGMDELPWAFIPEVKPDAEDEICFRSEAFAPLFCETRLDAPSTAEYVRRCVELCNDKLWGTLNATILVHPATLRVPEIAEAVDEAIAGLRYGTVAINAWAAVGYGLVITPWGGYPGHDLYDVQSGTGVVHNTLMFGRPQKTVVRAPFQMKPKPPWFATHRTARELGKKLSDLEAAPSPWKLPGILWAALRG